MSIDEAGHHGGAGEIEHLGVGHIRGRVAHCGDVPFLHHDGRHVAGTVGVHHVGIEQNQGGGDGHG